MTVRAKFEAGQRVILPANEKEGWPEEKGFIESTDGDLLTVRLYTQYRSEHDDGIREVHAGDVQAEQEHEASQAGATAR